MTATTIDTAVRREKSRWAGFGLLIVAASLYPRVELVPRDEGVTEILLWTPVEASDAVRVAIEEFERRHPEYGFRYDDFVVMIQEYASHKYGFPRPIPSLQVQKFPVRSDGKS